MPPPLRHRCPRAPLRLLALATAAAIPACASVAPRESEAPGCTARAASSGPLEAQLQLHVRLSREAARRGD